MLEEMINKSNKWKNLFMGITYAALIGAYATSMIGCNNDISPKTKNDKVYVLTVNRANTSVLRKMGWLMSPGKSDSYAIFNGSMDEANREIKNKPYSILAITGHHLSGTDTILGYNHQVSLNDLPKSKTIEAVIFDACATAGTDEQTIKNVYTPLIDKYPNLKVITGFRRIAPDQDGITPKLLLQTTKYLPRSTREYAQKSVNVNPDRIGTLVRVSNNKWDYYSKEGVQRIKI